MTRLFLASLVFLIGCQGQNPFRRQSNPMKNYPNAVEKADRPYVAGEKAAQPASPAAAQPGKTEAPKEPPCFEPLAVKISPDVGSSPLKFVEESENVYEIKVKIQGISAKDLKFGLPDTAVMSPRGREEDIYLYRLTWTPAKGTSAKKREPLEIGFEGDLPKGSCKGAKTKFSREISVTLATDHPSITFAGTKRRIKFGEPYSFKVLIEDKKATADKAPVLQAGKGDEGLDGSEAITKCEPGQNPQGSKFEFVCQFDSNLIKGIEEQKLANSGKEAVVSFSFTATSTASKLTSTPSTQKIGVVFEKIKTGANK